MFGTPSSSGRSLGRVLHLLLLAAVAAPVLSLPTRAVAQQGNDLLRQYNSIKWVVGPAKGDLGNAKIDVPAGFRFCGRDGAEKLAEVTQNTYGGELGVIMPMPKKDEILPDWYILFSFNDAGYVKDDEKDDLDDDMAADLLKSYQESQTEANKQRRSRGWTDLQITGWHQKPFYDQTTKNLTWAIIVADNEGESVNYDSKVLGRRGYMEVTMVLSREDVAAAVPQYNKLVGGLKFNSGETYAEYRDGDKIAKYGLIGLASGGLALAAVKWWKPLMKFGIFIVAAIGLALKKVFSIFRRSPAAG